MKIINDNKKLLEVNMSKVYAICGKICSGKSYYADELKKQHNAVILSVDELTLYLIDNEQGESYDFLVNKAKSYLLKKAVDIIETNSNVILDWGFWTSKEREKVNQYFNQYNITVEWHYIDITDARHQELIKIRNNEIEKQNNLTDFYVDSELLKKSLLQFEQPDNSDIDVWVDNK